MERTKKIALCGMLTALSVVLMMLTGIITIGTFALPALAGIVAVIAVIEGSVKYGISVYIASGVISALLAPDKEAVIYYIVFFGYYPVIKALIERINKHFIQWVLKFLVFNVAIIACFYASVIILSIPKESFTIMGYYVPYLFLIVGNGVFYLYDFALTSIITMYLRKWRKYIFKV